MSRIWPLSAIFDVLIVVVAGEWLCRYFTQSRDLFLTAPHLTAINALWSAAPFYVIAVLAARHPKRPTLPAVLTGMTMTVSAWTVTYGHIYVDWVQSGFAPDTINANATMMLWPALVLAVMHALTKQSA